MGFLIKPLQHILLHQQPKSGSLDLPPRINVQVVRPQKKPCMLLLTCGGHRIFIVYSISCCKSVVSSSPFKTTWPIKSCRENRSKSQTENCRYLCRKSSQVTLQGINRRFFKLYSWQNSYILILSYFLYNVTSWFSTRA